MSPAVLERDADLAGAEVVERRLRDRAREHMAAARPPARCSCGGLPERDEDGGRWRCSTCGKPTRAPAPDLPRGLLAAIGRVVAEAGGTDEDAHELAEVWARVLRDCERKGGAILTAVRLAECSCADGGDAGSNGRCSRCSCRVATGGVA